MQGRTLPTPRADNRHTCEFHLAGALGRVIFVDGDAAAGERMAVWK